jgi:hypothetical protein
MLQKQRGGGGNRTRWHFVHRPFTVPRLGRVPELQICGGPVRRVHLLAEIVPDRLGGRLLITAGFDEHHSEAGDLSTNVVELSGRMALH